VTAILFAASLALIVVGVALVYVPAALVALGAAGVALTVLHERKAAAMRSIMGNE
jgi:hypothetical protein